VSSEEPEESTITPLTACAASSSSSGMSGRAFFKVVPVKVWADDADKFVYTYAFIDEGSNVNMCSQRLVEELNLTVSSTNVELLTSGATVTMQKRVDLLGIQGINEPSAFSLQNAFVVDEVVDVSSSIPTPNIVQAYPHLKELDFPLLDEKGIDSLLGCDLHQAYMLKETLVGGPGEPCGLHTGLGWTIYGRDQGDQELHSSGSKLMVNFITSSQDNSESCERLLAIMAQDFHESETVAVPSLSQEDKQALYILNNTVKKVGDHYSVGLLWKDTAAQLPDSLPLAKRRMISLKKRFVNDETLFVRYSAKINEYITNYAEPVPTVPEETRRICYKPHYCTSATTKFRVVFDCSARFHGASLNDRLLQGPDLTNSVAEVLIRSGNTP